jgi:hypothetical protein
MKLHRLLGLVDKFPTTVSELMQRAPYMIRGMCRPELSVNCIKVKFTLFTKKKNVERFVEPTLLNSTAYCKFSEVSKSYPASTGYSQVLYNSHNKLIISLLSIKWLVFVMEMPCAFCGIRTKFLFVVCMTFHAVSF